MRLRDSERLTIYYINVVSNSLSILGNIFICAVYFKFQNLRTFPFKLVLILSIFDILNSIGFLIPTYSSEDSDLTCKIQSLVLNFSTLASVLWAVIIAFCLYYIIVKSRLYIENYIKYYIGSVVIICSIVSAVPFITDTYGATAGWCWILQTGKYDGAFYERYFSFFIPLWLLIIISVVLYILISRRLSQSDDSDNTRSAFNKKLKFYPMILILCFLPFTIKGVLEHFRVDFVMKNDYYFTMVTATFRGFYGLLNAFVYGFTNKVRKTLAAYFKGDEYPELIINFSTHTRRASSIVGTQCTVLTKNDIFSSDSHRFSDNISNN
ncbi:hypothetical protein SteCoe_23236 [Stentor coeruleus]|uniref:G-protein coupled receptors family 2 profile 2 domain-containing protein n=1 Tax=Stentor coeruleus TaxID=5963 RepID=A0A1R2BKF1_9CILI|nr:hypothetical protein SteCoe_23236 [Stentor coeruleus]